MSGYALISHPGSDNLGDDIQSLAARAFLPRVDRLVPREALDVAGGIAPGTRLILNGWFMHRPRHWPPHPDLTPLPISFHLTGRGRSRRGAPGAPGVILSPGNAGYLQRHGPVGARDAHTLDLLRAAGVDSYLSGCLTLTLRRPDGVAGGGPVVACDLTPPILAALARRTGAPPVAVTHDVDPATGVAERFARAETLLALYAGARAVVTTRLHAALPCLAMGTPVLFIQADQEAGRVAPALELAHGCTAAAFLRGDCAFDPDSPPANPERHLALADALRRRVAAFVAA